MMHRSRAAGLGLGLVAALSILHAPFKTQAIQLADGTVYFEHAPRLLDAATSSRTPSIAGATYYFTVELPENAGEPLGKLTLTSPNSWVGPQRIRFRTDATVAFEGTWRDRGDDISLRDVTVDEETRTIEVAFDPPVEPGTTVTVGLRPRRNPQAGGTYLYRVLGFPAGELAHGQPLGTARIQINDPSDVFILNYRWWD
ncbi:DUF2808 domain-containing protein [Leptolyngbya sp. AN02str]|uniref:DUF2808 domain-containing protein n=1 Tax=Leptolyngbya sp. AN02str TaxID=3423363 RepID=UPI003D317CCD